MKGRQPVRPPVVREVPEFGGSSIVEQLYQMGETVELSVVFDDPDSPKVTLETDRSSRVFILLAQANLRRGTVIRFRIQDRDVPPAVLARLNWYLHKSGYSKDATFRAWKRQNQAVEGGQVLWHSAAAWVQFKTILGISPVKKG